MDHLLIPIPIPISIIAQGMLPTTVASWAIVLIIVAGVIGIFLVVSRQAGIVLPSFVIQILWILAAVIVGVLAIKFLLGFV